MDPTHSTNNALPVTGVPRSVYYATVMLTLVLVVSVTWLRGRQTSSYSVDTSLVNPKARLHSFEFAKHYGVARGVCSEKSSTQIETKDNCTFSNWSYNAPDTYNCITKNNSIQKLKVMENYQLISSSRQRARETEKTETWKFQNTRHRIFSILIIMRTKLR